MSRIVKAFWYNGVNNVGDMLTVPILEHFGYKVEFAERNSNSKLLMVGSIMRALREGDVVLGAGCIVPNFIDKKNVTFLAVRGPRTRKFIQGSKVPEVYGDPALLLPLIYNPDVAVSYDTGIVPHYVDKRFAVVQPGQLLIDVQAPWQEVVRKIKSCRRIVSSSLHGLIIAEAYGIPVEWVRYSDNIIGGNFKFQDYLLGTGREAQVLGQFPPIPDLPGVQTRLIKAIERLKDYEYKWN